MWYTLIRPHLSVQNAVDEVADKVRKEMKAGQLVEAEEPR